MADKKEVTVEELQKLLDTATADLKATTELLVEHEAAAKKGGDEIKALRAEVEALKTLKAQLETAAGKAADEFKTLKAQLATAQADLAKANNAPVVSSVEVVDVVAVQTIGVAPGKTVGPGTPLSLTVDDAAELLAAKAVVTPEAYAALQAAKARAVKAA